MGTCLGAAKGGWCFSGGSSPRQHIPSKRHSGHPFLRPHLPGHHTIHLISSIIMTASSGKYCAPTFNSQVCCCSRRQPPLGASLRTSTLRGAPSRFGLQSLHKNRGIAFPRRLRTQRSDIVMCGRSDIQYVHVCIWPW